MTSRGCIHRTARTRTGPYRGLLFTQPTNGMPPPPILGAAVLGVRNALELRLPYSYARRANRLLPN